MCGFVCFWNVGDTTMADAMIAKIAHRGPDEVHVARLPGAPVTMAHCRLSIIGPEDGAQPIRQTGDMLVANGEIYNHQDLRAILGEAAFETASDSETILQLFRSGRTRWIDKLDGMFAFVLATKDRIIAARDPLGIKPLYVATLGDGPGLRIRVEGLRRRAGHKRQRRSRRAISTTARDGWRQWYRTPQGAAEAEPDLDIGRTARELRLVLEAAVAKMDGRRRRGGQLPVGRA